MTDFRALPSKWDDIELAAQPIDIGLGCEISDKNTTIASALLDLRSRNEALANRLEALEARDKEDANCWASVRQSMHRLRERIETLEQRPIPGTVELAAPTPEAAPVADDDEPQTLHTIALKMVDTLEQLRVLPEILDTLRRAIREPMQQPTPEAAPVATDAELLTDGDSSQRQWYSYDPEEGIEIYSSREQAKSAAQSIMGSYQVAAHSDGWHEDMESVSWGMLIPVEHAQIVARGFNEPGEEIEEWVRYELKAPQPAPVTDCPACEGTPSAANNPCCVCGLPAAPAGGLEGADG